MTLRKLANLSLLLLLALAVGYVFLTWRAQAAADRAEARFPVEGQIVEVDGHKVHAVVMGEGPDVVLIHGASGNTRDMTFALAPLLAQSYRVIALDRPGFGYTDRLGRGRESLADQARLLQRAAAELGAETPLVLGQSYGGAVALAWALEAPEALAGLITVSTVSNPWEGGVDTIYHVVGNPIGSFFLPPLVHFIYGEERIAEAIETVLEPEAVPEGYGEHLGVALSLRPDSVRANAQQRITLEAQINAQSQRYPSIRVPTEILHGDTDFIAHHTIHSVPLSQQIPGANLTLIEGAGHMPHIVHASEVAAAVDRAAARAGLR